MSDAVNPESTATTDAGSAASQPDMRTTAGLRRVDVIYKRIDDDFTDPLVPQRASTGE